MSTYVSVPTVTVRLTAVETTRDLVDVRPYLVERHDQPGQPQLDVVDARGEVDQATLVIPYPVDERGEQSPRGATSRA